MVLTEKGLGDAIQEYIEKDERDAIVELINFQINKMQVGRQPGNKIKKTKNCLVSRNHLV